MADTLELRADLLVIARRSVPGEPITRQDAEMPLSKLVTQLSADPETSHTALALIAVSLASYIEKAGSLSGGREMKTPT